MKDKGNSEVGSFDFTRQGSRTFTPDAERRNPSSQREGLSTSARPALRVFVFSLDLKVFSTSSGAVVPQNDLRHIQQPLVGFLQRVLGPQDLFGFLTS